MNPFACGIPVYGFNSRKIALQERKKALEDELRAIEDHRRRTLRQGRRETIIKQAQQIESLVRQLQSPRPDATPVEASQDTTLHWVLAKVMRQNDELQSVLINQFSSPPPEHKSTASSTLRSKFEEPAKIDVTRDAEETNESDSAEIRNLIREDIVPRSRELSTEKPRADASPWAVVENLPLVEWNDQDEELLDKLLSGDVDENQYLPLPGVLPESSGDGTSSDADVQAILQKKKQQHEERVESRRKLSLLFEASSIANSTGIRRPRWRIDQDIENGVVMPFDEDGAVSELPMASRQVFRSAVVTVLTVLELQRLLRDKRLREREKSIRDLDAMLNVYFDATRVWLAKLVKTPLLSILQDPSLDLDVSTKTGLFQGSKGFSKWLVGQKASPTVVAPDPARSGDQGVSTNEQAKLVRLKVRVKGVIDAIVKAIEKGDVPNGILEFWKRLTRDGVYFPSTYPLFPTERAALNLDALSATRDTSGVASSGHSRFQIILVNFVLLRILIPHVVLTPWSVGLGGATGGSASKQKAISKNLQNVATLLYVIISRLSPLPPVISVDGGLALRLGMRRRSVEVAPVQANNQTDQPSNRTGNGQDEDKRFGSIDELHATLMPEKLFPVDNLTPFIDEQQRRLQGVFSLLRIKLHPTLLQNDGPATE